MTQTCDFCIIIAGKDPHARILYSNDRVTAFFPLDPATRGHTVVVPHRHVAQVTELSEEESRDLGQAVRRISQAVRDGLGPEGINVIQSNGEVATQSVDHVHFHVVPRSTRDRMKLEWPESAAEDEAAQDVTLRVLRNALPRENPEQVAPEDRRQHLAFIQAVITRMSQASSSSKSWLLPIVTLTYGYAVTKESIPVALLGCVAVLVFGLLDANYLKQERAFVELYDQVTAGEPIPVFAMNPALASSTRARVNYWPDRKEFASWAIALVHGPLLATGVGIAIWLHCR